MLIILSIILVAAAVLMLGVRVFFVKGGKFPSSHIHDNKALRERGIDCASNAHHREKR